MELANLVRIAIAQQAPAVAGNGRRRGRGGLRAGLQRRRLRALRRAQGQERRVKAARREHRLQAQSINRSGHGRTEDHHVRSEVGQKRVLTKGKGKWKSWTPDAVLRAGFAAEAMASRDAAKQIDGGSAGATNDCRLFVAQCLDTAQTDGVKKILDQLTSASGGAPLAFAISNLMFDESEFDLNVKGCGEGAWSVLASHAQVTYSWGRECHDIHVIRPPRVLPRKTAATMWPVLSAGLGGLWPGVTSVAATFRTVLVTCDAGTANLKLLRHLNACLPRSASLIVTLCAQHRTGNVIERATKLLGILPGSYAVSKTIKQGNWMRQLGLQVQKVLAADLVIMREEPPGLQDEWAQARVANAALMDLVVKNDSQDGAESTGGYAATVAKFLKFFPTPWRGPSQSMLGFEGKF